MKRSTQSIWSEWPFVAGLIFSVLVIVVFALSLTLPVDGSDRANKWAYLRAATPNEIGDTLAGLAGSLAFVWLVVTVLLQAKELREQRQEFQKIASAQDEQVKLLQVQGEIFLEEQRQRHREIEKSRLTSLISSLVMLTERVDEECLWSLRTKDGTGTLDLTEPFRTSVSKKIRNCTAALKTWIESLPSNAEEMTVLTAPKKANFQELREVLIQVIKLSQELGGDQVIRIENLRSRELLSLIDQLLTANIWNDHVGETIVVPSPKGPTGSR